MTNLKAFTSSGNREKKITTLLTPQKKAYTLKIVSDSIDESDECPTYDFRISGKPLEFLSNENLKCTGLKAPQAKLEFPND